MTLKYIWRSFSLGCHFHVHFSYPWHAFASHGLPAIAELLVLLFLLAVYNGHITKFSWGDFRASPPRLFGRGGDRPMESALVRYEQEYRGSIELQHKYGIFLSKPQCILRIKHCIWQTLVYKSVDRWSFLIYLYIVFLFLCCRVAVFVFLYFIFFNTK